MSRSFALGYGLSYGEPHAVPVLSEVSGLDAAIWNVDRYIVDGKVLAPWTLLVDNGGIVSSQSVAAGQALSWNGDGSARAMVHGAPIDLTRQANADLSLLMEYRLDHAADATGAADARVCTRLPGRCRARVGPVLGAAAGADGWQTLKIRLSLLSRCRARQLQAIDAPFVLRTAGHLGITLAHGQAGQRSGWRDLPAAQLAW